MLSLQLIDKIQLFCNEATIMKFISTYSSTVVFSETIISLTFNSPNLICRLLFLHYQPRWAILQTSQYQAHSCVIASQNIDPISLSLHRLPGLKDDQHLLLYFILPTSPIMLLLGSILRALLQSTRVSFVMVVYWISKQKSDPVAQRHQFTFHLGDFKSSN